MLVFSHPVPVLAVVGHILDVGVVIEVVRPVVAHRRHQHDVIDEIELEFVEADKVDNIGDDVAIGPRLVTKCIGKLID